MAKRRCLPGRHAGFAAGALLREGMAWLAAVLLIGPGCARAGVEATFTSVPSASDAPAQQRHGQPPSSFASAKRYAIALYADHARTLYCDCAYADDKRVLPESCGYTSRTAGARAQRIEWEHLVPAFAFGAERACWARGACVDSKGRAYGGRRCCRRSDSEFASMEADLHNLVPEIGELNADRSSYAFGEVEGEERAYGACDFEVNRATRTAEPPPRARGDVARAYLYMAHTYGNRTLPLSPAQREQFERWHASDPPDEWERLRDARIAKIQGANNPFVRGVGPVNARSLEPEP
jgi:deoxyribonuclease-1